MRFANVRELKLETNKVLEKSIKNGPVVLTRNGKPIAMLRSISEDDFVLRFDRTWKNVRESAERLGYGLKDVSKLIKDARGAKKKRK